MNTLMNGDRQEKRVLFPKGSGILPFTSSLSIVLSQSIKVVLWMDTEPLHVHSYELSRLISSNGENSTMVDSGDQGSGKNESTAAVKLQKVYRSYRTRRRLADSAVVAEELWWRAIDYARLNYSTISFYNFTKPESAAARWSRIRLNASKVGKGLSKDGRAKELTFQHWLEAIDPRHRYGHNLNLYYEEWYKAEAGQPFFYWLDIGDGKEVDLKRCSRLQLRRECIKYLGPQEREHYEYIITGGTIMQKLTGEFLDTEQGQEGSKWIFVMSSSKTLYVGEKKKGLFHHSSFLAGRATLAAGRLSAEGGKLKSVSAYSGHYRPTDENLGSFLSFLKENGIDTDEIQVTTSTTEEDDIRKSVADKSRQIAALKYIYRLKSQNL